MPVSQVGAKRLEQRKEKWLTACFGRWSGSLVWIFLTIQHIQLVLQRDPYLHAQLFLAFRWFFRSCGWLLPASLLCQAWPSIQELGHAEEGSFWTSADPKRQGADEPPSKDHRLRIRQSESNSSGARMIWGNLQICGLWAVLRRFEPCGFILHIQKNVWLCKQAVLDGFKVIYFPSLFCTTQFTHGCAEVTSRKAQGQDTEKARQDMLNNMTLSCNGSNKAGQQVRIWSDQPTALRANQLACPVWGKWSKKKWRLQRLDMGLWKWMTWNIFPVVCHLITHIPTIHFLWFIFSRSMGNIIMWPAFQMILGHFLARLCMARS